MSKWQDDLYEAVFDAAGLLRFGPKRQRLTRADYKKLTKAKAQQAKDRDASAALTGRIAAQEAKLSGILSEAADTRSALAIETSALGGEKLDLCPATFGSGPGAT